MTQPTTPEDTLLTQFLAHLKAGKSAQANAVLAQAIKREPSKAADYALLIGGLLSQNGQYSDAIPLYQEAIRLRPHQPIGYFYLGVVYHALGKDAESSTVWDQLTRRFPGHALDHYQKGLRHLKSNQSAEAKAALQQALALLEPTNPVSEDVRKAIAAIERQGAETKAP